MDGFISLILLCSLVAFTRASDASNFACKSAKCSLVSPEIRSPFRIEGLHPKKCGVPRFTLFCTQNTTAIRFLGNREFFVKTISYDTRSLSLVDPKNCVHEVFLNFNLSLTPFRYYYVLHHYKYVNCSDKIVGLEPVPCLSGSNHHVYVVEPSLSLPVSCNSIKTVAIPFSYSPYLSDNSFGLKLTWPLSIRVDEAVMKSSCRLGIPCHLEYNYRVIFGVLSIIGGVCIVGTLLYASLSKYGGEFNEEKVEETMGEVESDKLLGEYEALVAL